MHLDLRSFYRLRGWKGGKIPANFTLDAEEMDFPLYGYVVEPKKLIRLKVTVTPTPLMPTFNGRPGKSSAHRIFVNCPNCYKLIPAGRTHNHVGSKTCKTKAEAVRAERVQKLAQDILHTRWRQPDPGTFQVQFSKDEMAHVIAAVGYRYATLLGKEDDYAETMHKVLEKLRAARAVEGKCGSNCGSPDCPPCQIATEQLAKPATRAEQNNTDPGYDSPAEAENRKDFIDIWTERRNTNPEQW